MRIDSGNSHLGMQAGMQLGMQGLGMQGLGSHSGLGLDAARDALDAQRAADAGRAAETQATQDEGAAAESAAQRLEALFATMLVKEMRRAMPNGFFGQSPGAETFEGWLDEHIGKSLADSGALDLAGQIRVSLQAKAAGEAQ